MLRFQKDLSKIITGVGAVSSGLGIYHFISNYNQPLNSELQKELEFLKQLAEEQSKINTSVYKQILTSKTEMLGHITNLDNIISKLKNIREIPGANAEAKTELIELENALNQFRNGLQNVDFSSSPQNQEEAKIAEAFNKLGNSNNNGSASSDLLSSNFNNNNNFWEEMTKYINLYKDWLETLTREQAGLIMNISLWVTALGIFISLISIYYSNWLITTIKIEEKYPRLGKILALRRKFQTYFFTLNSLFFITIIIVALVVNIWGFLRTFPN